MQIFGVFSGYGNMFYRTFSVQSVGFYGGYTDLVDSFANLTFFVLLFGLVWCIFVA